MALKYGFFNSVSGDRKYNAEDIGRFLHGLVNTGVYADVSDGLQVIATGNMTAAVLPGQAMIERHYLENDERYGVTFNVGGALPRYDAVVARLDMTTREIGIFVKEGTAASVPVYPTLTRNGTTEEIMLAAVYINKYATAITQADIVDTRADTTVCGWVAGLIQQVDTSTLFRQWQAAYEAAYAQLLEYTAQQQAAINNFMANLTGTLNVNTFVAEYTNAVDLTESTNVVAVGIDNFVPVEDVLFVNVGGLVFAQNSYTVTGTGSSATVTFTSTLKAGDHVEFRILKSQIGNVEMASNEALLAFSDTEVMADDGELVGVENEA